MACPYKQTKAWVEAFIVKFNICPFAKPSIEQQGLDYHICEHSSLDEALEATLTHAHQLAQDPKIESRLLIFNNGFTKFEDFLELIDYCDAMLAPMGLTGQVQIAHFHPDYCFADVDPEDPQNFTNRAPWPTLHLIDEHAMELALSGPIDSEAVPERNIVFCQRRGHQYLQQLLNSIKSL
ncbi:DUF1415 family protein [Paraferrimonas sp. SM1919]|uniref:DUF1415 family protein n=1 Tax=Paraferrimonas sp. SM1919 TaxID=2662263 RepID=UPI0013CF7B73|nr:DUF1415 domain-containing protein [Paraferrimonas sp. SM1919]